MSLSMLGEVQLSVSFRRDLMSSKMVMRKTISGRGYRLLQILGTNPEPFMRACACWLSQGFWPSCCSICLQHPQLPCVCRVLLQSGLNL